MMGPPRRVVNRHVRPCVGVSLTARKVIEATELIFSDCQIWIPSLSPFLLWFLSLRRIGMSSRAFIAFEDGDLRPPRWFLRILFIKVRMISLGLVDEDPLSISQLSLRCGIV